MAQDDKPEAQQPDFDPPARRDDPPADSWAEWEREADPVPPAFEPDYPALRVRRARPAPELPVFDPDYREPPVPPAPVDTSSYGLFEGIGVWLRGWWSVGAVLRLVALALISTYFVLQCAPYWVIIIDDSYITFRFVDLFVQGYGWRFNPDGPRVEGLTNFLWALCLVVPAMLQWDLMFVSKIMGQACGVATIAASWGMARSLRGRDDWFNMIPPFLLATNAHFANWAMMGLETLMQVMLVVTAYWRFEAERRDPRNWLLSPFVCVLAAMTRIDSLYYLFPLGVYGLWLVLWGRLPLRRLFRWGVYAAIPFVIYWGWRYTYYDDVMPNTYYAKQRLVGESRAMGLEQLRVFYFDQADFKKNAPMEIARVPADMEYGWLMKLDRMLWNLSFPQWNSLAWICFWVLALLLALQSTATPLLGAMAGRRRRKESAFFSDVHLGKIVIMVVMPWAMNVYYIYHVNGDWMPSFRFFQIVIPFIGVAAAIGFGWFFALACEFLVTAWLKIAAGIASMAVALALLISNGYEQSRIIAVSVYGPGSVYWGWRSNDWFMPKQLFANYRRGFVPALNDVSNYLLTDTQDNAYIFMSDIGQPLYFADHLNLYDVDGLTDPFLAHAPSTRGRLPTKKQRIQQLIATQPPDKALTSADMKNIEKQAERDVFNAFLARNTSYIMEQRQPEYLLIFLNHERPDPKSKGWAYPEISARVYAHPKMKNYVDDWQMGKIANVFNHVFRRSDVPREVPDKVKLARLFRAIDRNPRVSYLVGLLYRESLKMENISPEDKKRVRAVVEDAFVRWQGDPVVRELASLARQGGDNEMARIELARALRENPADIASYWPFSRIHEDEKDWAAAIDIMKRALPHAPQGDNAVLYHLAWLSEQAGDITGGLAYIDEAIRRIPTQARAYSDKGAMLERASRLPAFTPGQQIEFRRQAIPAFEMMIEQTREPLPHIVEIIARLRRETAAPEPTPAPQPTPDAKAARDAEVSGFLRGTGAIAAPPRAETDYQRGETKYE